MDVIPAINCSDESCLRERASASRSLGVSMVHIDVADGEFTPVVTWGWQDPSALRDALGDSLKIEAHLMVSSPKTVISGWMEVSERVFVHIESERASDAVSEAILQGSAEVGVTLLSSTPVERVIPYVDGSTAEVGFVQILAVNPGLSGQTFNPTALETLRILKRSFPNLNISVDGGVNREVAEAVRRAGADSIVSSSYIWDSKDPKSSYMSLSGII
jgi:ribulose-phosphate 3-epimerase